MEKKPKQGIIVIRKVIRTSLSIAAAGRSGRIHELDRKSVDPGRHIAGYFCRYGVPVITCSENR